MEEALGKKTKGWLSPFLTHTDNTPRILEENGVEYLCDYTADDHPFKFNTPQNNLIAVPYTVELNDIPAFLGHSGVGVSSEASKIVRIKNTLEMREVWATETMLSDIEKNPRLELNSEPFECKFDNEGAIMEHV